MKYFLFSRMYHTVKITMLNILFIGFLPKIITCVFSTGPLLRTIWNNAGIHIFSLALALVVLDVLSYFVASEYQPSRLLDRTDFGADYELHEFAFKFSVCFANPFLKFSINISQMSLHADDNWVPSCHYIIQRFNNVDHFKLSKGFRVEFHSFSACVVNRITFIKIMHRTKLHLECILTGCLFSRITRETSWIFDNSRIAIWEYLRWRENNG